MNPLPPLFPLPFPLTCLHTPRQARCGLGPLLVSNEHVNRMRPCTSSSHNNNKSQQQPTVACNSACVCVCVSVCYLWETRFHFPLNAMREGEPEPDLGPVNPRARTTAQAMTLSPCPLPPIGVEPEVEHTAADAVKQKTSCCRAALIHSFIHSFYSYSFIESTTEENRTQKRVARGLLQHPAAIQVVPYQAIYGEYKQKQLSHMTNG